MSKISTEIMMREKIYHVRGIPVMLDSELADIYGIETKTFNQAVKRNIERFPDMFRFQLSELEHQNLRSQIVTSSSHGGRRYLPYVFTEQGVAMLSAVLKSKTAIELSIQIIDAFVQMRRFVAAHSELIERLQNIEQKQISFETKSQEKFEALFSALEEKPLVPKQGIFYDGQIFDAYLFISKLIRTAKHSIILIDNYVDETVLEHLSKSRSKVRVSILTKNISDNLKLDIKKYSQQYQKIDLLYFDLSHDRFLIIDQKDIYHIGASLKDLGKKWFAFSKLGTASFGLMEQIKSVIQNNLK
ncbi:ORF6N domain-containing protein [Legionella taurinensis]|uniref:ORF6N domain-containing protein n=1 Tax=Legionella taurinensis TaxID=70611 RepID=UPI001A19A114|nr:ORF6N domain-containing protein [Legionella taurinensis]MDX1838176.1 ORF6N domain-containing protein [Legionella taurinensis]HAU1025101.1 ORF6N domain-containing protein [Legionella pneumophila]